MRPVTYIRLLSTSSTNDEVRRMLADDPDCQDLTVVTTISQTAGRGQQGNHWEAVAGKNLTFSVLLKPHRLPANRQFILSQMMALAVQRTYSQYVDDVTVKWPNDIYWRDRKLSGTLIECDLQGKDVTTAIVGVGMNVNQTVFVSDAPNPVSLRQLTGRNYPLETILDQLMDQFTQLYGLPEAAWDSMVRKPYCDVLYRREGFHPFQDASGRFDASIESIEPTGHLVLLTREGERRRYEFKEVHFLLPEDESIKKHR